MNSNDYLTPQSPARFDDDDAYDDAYDDDVMKRLQPAAAGENTKV